MHDVPIQNSNFSIREPSTKAQGQVSVTCCLEFGQKPYQKCTRSGDHADRDPATRPLTTSPGNKV